MEVTINYKVYQEAQTYAQQHGLNLASVIEKLLIHFIRQDKQPDEQAVPDVVLSLLGAGAPISDDDLNGREAYYQYVEEKYK